VNEQSGREYLDSLKRIIATMTPLEQACSAAMLQLAELVVCLLNERRFDAVDAMRHMAEEIFQQAEELKHEKKHVQ
jgi:hypothetical protein